MFEQPDSPPELTPSEKADLADALEYKDSRIEDIVYMRMRDPEYIIDALSVLITDNPSTQATLSNLVMGYGDIAVHRGDLYCDVKVQLREQAERDYELGQL